MGFLQRFAARRGRELIAIEARLLSRFGFVRPPSAVQWSATAACDLRCPHCYTRAGRRAEGELTDDEARRLIVDELAAMGRPELVVAGGEALLRRDLEGVLAHAARRRVPWSLHSHGGHVAARADLFRRFPPTMVALSLDGPRAFHDAFRGKAGAFDAVIEAARVLKEAGVAEVVIGTTITRDNADLVADLSPIVAASCADAWGLHLFAPEGRGAEHARLAPSDDQLRRVASFARRARASLRVDLDNEWGGAGDDDAHYRDRPFYCGAGRFTCVVTSTGDVVPCTTTDVSDAAGNVRTMRLRDLWARGFAAFRRASDDVRAATDDCWLQTRHGKTCREAAFRTPLREELPV
jgi:radical SAM protein with 4Fe4S-binding SPASM domain